MHNCLGRHFKKVQAFCAVNQILKDCFSVKLFQVVVFGVFTIVLGAVALSKPGECNTPVQVFLEGLFGLYMAGFWVNLFVGFMYFCYRFNSLGCINWCRNLQKGITICYWPLHITFCMYAYSDLSSYGSSAAACGSSAPTTAKKNTLRALLSPLP